PRCKRDRLRRSRAESFLVPTRQVGSRCARRRQVRMTDSFADGISIDSIRDGDRVDLTADQGQCDAIAKRLGLGSIDRLEAHATLERQGEIVQAKGRLLASL